MEKANAPVPEGFHTITPQLVCREAERAIEFYKRAFGADVQRVSKDDGQHVTHAQLKIGDSIVMLSDEFAAYGCLSPLSIGGSAVTLHIYTADVDAFSTAPSLPAQKSPCH